MTTTISRVYDTYLHAAQAVSKLKAMGIPEADISLVANRNVSSAYENATDSTATESGAGIGLLAIPGLGPVVAAGWLAATAAGTLGGIVAGGIVGALMEAGVPEADAHVYSESIRRGGTMVTVRTDDTNESLARSVLDSLSPINIVARRNEYHKAGWTKFDPDAPDYTLSEAQLERIRRQN